MNLPRNLVEAMVVIGVHFIIHQRCSGMVLPPLEGRPPPKPREEPKPQQSMSAIDAQRLADNYGYEGRYRAPGQRAGIAKLLMEDTDA